MLINMYMVKSNSIIFDTNVWLGMLIKQDSLHKKSLQLAREYKSYTKIVPEYIVLETLTLLKQHTTITEVQNTLQFFLDSDTVEVLPAVHSYDKTITLFKTSHDKHLSFVDMSLLALSRDFEVKTFDKKLAAAIKKYSF